MPAESAAYLVLSRCLGDSKPPVLFIWARPLSEVHTLMSSWTPTRTAESAFPLLSISHGHHITTMDPEGLVEKDGVSSAVVGSAEFTSSSSNPYSSHAITAYEDEALATDQGRLRRLFSFVQLLAFALTFMSSWEVIAM